MKKVFKTKCWAVIHEDEVKKILKDIKYYETITYFGTRKEARDFIINWNINGKEHRVEVTTKIVK